MNDGPMVEWQEAGAGRSARWRSGAGHAPPRRVVLTDDTLSADRAWHLACEGTAMLWVGDWQNARHLLDAMKRRVDAKSGRRRRPHGGSDEARETPSAQAFHVYRQAQAQRAHTLGMLLVGLDGDDGIPLRRAPELREAIREAWGAPDGAPSVASLRELLGVVGAHEWRRKGVPIPALAGAGYDRIHPHYGVFSPVRGEYVDLVARAPLPTDELAFDIGTGTGVLAAVIARRGVRRIVATDVDPGAIECARDNLVRLGLADRVEIVGAGLFPEGRAPLVVCNPPWLPGRASSRLERAVYDEGSGMLRGFLAGLRAHLTADGEGWLVLSDLAERLGLRTRSQLLEWIAQAGLAVIDRLDTQPRHGKAHDADDPFHAARAGEVTSLWRLRSVVPATTD